MAVFWVVAPCCLVEVYRRFRVTYCLHHQGDSGVKIDLKVFFFILMVELQATRLWPGYIKWKETCVGFFISLPSVGQEDPFNGAAECKWSDDLPSMAFCTDLQKIFVYYWLIRNGRGTKKEWYIIMKIYNLILIEPKFTINELSPINKVTGCWFWGINLDLMQQHLVTTVEELLCSCDWDICHNIKISKPFRPYHESRVFKVSLSLIN
jgi:hypothetical protein